MQRFITNLHLAVGGIAANKLRAFLTALGIIFGVAAVIAMLAIGAGAKQSILDQMRLIGANNIVIESIGLEEQTEEAENNENNTSNQEDNTKPYSPGLTLADLDAIGAVTPTVEHISPEIIISTNIVVNGLMQKGRCVGIKNTFFDLNQLELERGSLFHDRHLNAAEPVCIIGKKIQNRFFGGENPIGQSIKCGQTWLKIVGVLAQRVATKESLEQLGLRDYNSDIFVPVTTALVRIKDRSRIQASDLGNRGRSTPPDNYHQLDRALIRVTDSKRLRATADLIGRILKRRHFEVVDFEIEVPELLLQQEQKTQDTFNLVLAVIAGISLLVGGIGIMNIMLASVLERIKEIGLRRSIGATEQDIVWQFLLEAVIISLLGGMIGVVLGIVSAHFIAQSADIPTVVSLWSILLAFGVAASIGLIFGLFPARKAARQDPIKALRTE